MSRHNDITPPLASTHPLLHDWNRCAVAGCTGTRVLGRQGCRNHPDLTRKTCHRLNPLPEITPERIAAAFAEPPAPMPPSFVALLAQSDEIAIKVRS